MAYLEALAPGPGPVMSQHHIISLLGSGEGGAGSGPFAIRLQPLPVSPPPRDEKCILTWKQDIHSVQHSFSFDAYEWEI